MTMTTTRNELILDAARGRTTERTPVWLMRQAGRFDPEYRKLRERCGLPLEEMFRTPELAAEITLLPRRLGVDAMILFQDILTPCTPLGTPFRFQPGPVLESPVRTVAAIDALRTDGVEEELAFVAETIRLVRNELDGEIPLLGFAGAPFTVAAFMIAGGSPGNELQHTRQLMSSDPAALHRMLETITQVTITYLKMQIRCGVAAVQLFESMSDLMTDAEYRTFAHPYQRRIFAAIGEVVPRILFAKERSDLDLMIETGADVLSVGKGVDLAKAIDQYGDRVAFQGNVDNYLLAERGESEIDDAVHRCIQAGGHRGHILNLSHGLLKDTPFDNVCRLIEICRNTRIETALPAVDER